MSEHDTTALTTLLEAARTGSPERVRELLRADPSLALAVHDPAGTWGSCDTKSALHVALMRVRQCGSKEDGLAVVQALLEAGADVTAVRKQYDWRGCGHTETAFDMALATCNPSLLEAFLSRGADPNKEKRIDRHSMRTDGRTITVPLHATVRRADVHATGVLLRAGANVDAAFSEVYRNERGFNENSKCTAIHLAVRANSLDCLLLLLAEGAAVDAEATHLEQVPTGAESPHDDPRREGFVPSVRCVPVTETALHIAVRTKQPGLVRALLAVGADRTKPRVFGGEKASPEELAGDDAALRDALKTAAGWSPENHRYFSTRLQDQVKAVLLVAKAKGWTLPDDALAEIFTKLAVMPATAAA